jgi:hypothetical protein
MSNFRFRALRAPRKKEWVGNMRGASPALKYSW